MLTSEIIVNTSTLKPKIVYNLLIYFQTISYSKLIFQLSLVQMIPTSRGTNFGEQSAVTLAQIVGWG